MTQKNGFFSKRGVIYGFTHSGSLRWGLEWVNRKRRTTIKMVLQQLAQQFQQAIRLVLH
jgi:hypothetical protein